MFAHLQRVYFGDTEAGGVVYHGAQIEMLERARTEWLLAVGLTQRALQEQHQTLLTIAAIDISYRRPGRLDDALSVTVEPARRGRASMVLNQRIIRRSDEALIAKASVRIAVIDAQTLRPKAMPSALESALELAQS